MIIAWLTSGASVAATPREDLTRFYDEVKSFSARFQQVVLDEAFSPVEEASGRVFIKRPGRFRWDYEPPSEQEIVSDGERVWLYDAELEQVTIRALSKTLGQTPASLLAGGSDFESDFDVSELDRTGSINWVRMRPLQQDTGFEDVRIGFEDGVVRIMELVDGLGQTTRITFTDVRNNPDIPEARFTFVPPPGVDVNDQTRELGP